MLEWYNDINQLTQLSAMSPKEKEDLFATYAADKNPSTISSHAQEDLLQNDEADEIPFTPLSAEGDHDAQKPEVARSGGSFHDLTNADTDENGRPRATTYSTTTVDETQHLHTGEETPASPINQDVYISPKGKSSFEYPGSNDISYDSTQGEAIAAGLIGGAAGVAAGYSLQKGDQTDAKDAVLATDTTNDHVSNVANPVAAPAGYDLHNHDQNNVAKNFADDEATEHVPKIARGSALATDRTAETGISLSTYLQRNGFDTSAGQVEDPIDIAPIIYPTEVDSKAQAQGDWTVGDKTDSAKGGDAIYPATDGLQTPAVEVIESRLADAPGNNPELKVVPGTYP